MDDLPAACLLLFSAAITPGPNNLAILHLAARHGLSRTLAAIGAIVAGGMLLFLASAAGVTTMLARHPGLRAALAAAGAGYLVWLALRLLFTASADTPPAAPAAPERAIRPFGLLWFQLVNPKAWIMAVTVSAAWPAHRPGAYLPLALAYALIPTACLLAWATLGAGMSHWLARPRRRVACDRAMAALLIVAAGLTVYHP